MADNEVADIQEELVAIRHNLINVHTMDEVREFFAEKHDNLVILTRQEARLEKEFIEVEKMADYFEERYEQLIGTMQRIEDRDILEIREMKDSLMDYSSEIIAKRERVKFSHRVVCLVDHRDLLEIFEKLINSFTQLQNVIAGVLRSFKGENNSPTTTPNMVQWTHLAGFILPILTEALISLHGNNVGRVRLNQMNNLLDRVKQLYCPHWLFEFVDAVGKGVLEKMRTFQENIEDYQLELGQLIRDSGNLFEYNQPMVQRHN